MEVNVQMRYLHLLLSVTDTLTHFFLCSTAPSSGHSTVFTWYYILWKEIGLIIVLAANAQKGMYINNTLVLDNRIAQDIFFIKDPFEITLVVLVVLGGSWQS